MLDSADSVVTRDCEAKTAACVQRVLRANAVIMARMGERDASVGEVCVGDRDREV